MLHFDDEFTIHQYIPRDIDLFTLTNDFILCVQPKKIDFMCYPRHTYLEVVAHFSRTEGDC